MRCQHDHRAPLRSAVRALHHRRPVWLPLVALLALGACGGDAGPTEPAGQLPADATLRKSSGDAQSDTVAAVLQDSLAVQLLRKDGRPVAGVVVEWTTQNGSISGQSTTNADGRAAAQWTLGTTAGTQTATARVATLAPLTFTATARPGAAAGLVISRDSLLLDKWGDTASVSAAVRDRHGNALPGTVTWQSSDSTVARVAATGQVTSHRAGRVLLTASTGSATATLPVRVVVQRNAACRVPQHTARGTVAGIPAFGGATVLTELPATRWPGWRSLAADYDGDGDEDVVRLEYSYPGTTPYSGETRVFRNDGGRLVDATSQVLAAPVIPDHARDFEIADFTGDRVPDIYVAQHGYDAEPFPGAPNLFFTWQGGKLTEIAQTAFSPHQPNGFTHGSASGDVDCDGDIDILELNLLSKAPNTLFLNNGSGRFTAAPASALPISGLHDAGGQVWQEVAFVDIDSDGDPDAYLGARSGNGWNRDAVLVNDGFGRFRRAAAIQLPAGRFTPNRAVNNAKAADFDGDGLQDLLLFEIPQPFSTRSAIRLWINQGDGSFADRSTSWGIPAECSAEIIEPLRVADVNRDGWPDVLLPNGCPELGSGGILFNRGTRFQFFAFSAIEPWLQHGPATPLDVDGDGDLDLFFGDRGGNPVLVRNRM